MRILCRKVKPSLRKNSCQVSQLKLRNLKDPADMTVSFWECEETCDEIELMALAASAFRSTGNKLSRLEDVAVVVLPRGELENLQNESFFRIESTTGATLLEHVADSHRDVHLLTTDSEERLFSLISPRLPDSTKPPGPRCYSSTAKVELCSCHWQLIPKVDIIKALKLLVEAGKLDLDGMDPSLRSQFTIMQGRLHSS